ncbi:MAG: [protein-PII] uridylyltransferase [Candidatus Binatia bacterium]
MSEEQSSFFTHPSSSSLITLMQIDLPDIPLPLLPSADPEVGVDPRLDLTAVCKTYRLHAHEELNRLYATGASGGFMVEFYTHQIDRLIHYLFDATTRLYMRRNPLLQQRCAVLAVGGYGRREMNAHSDIDLQFLYEKITPYVETVCEIIPLSLTDAGFVSRPVVRTVRDCVRLADQDLTIKSALLDSRYLCGDEPLVHKFTTVLEGEIIAKNPKRFFQEKAEESRKRHHEKGGSIYMLEPDIKDGPGGLRDLHTARWLAKVKYKIGDLRELITNGVASAATLAQIDEARDFLWWLRNGLHLLERKEEDRLSFERQEQLAPTLGFAEVTEFMRCYYGHATVVSAFSQMMVDRCLETRRFYNFIGRARSRKIREGEHIVDGALEVTKAELLTSDPLNILTVFHDAQRHKVRLTDATRQLIRAALSHYAPANVAALPALREAFLTILNWKERVTPTLYEMHALGVLEWLLPEFAHLHWRTQRDLYHVYTVDEHTLHGVSELERLRNGDYKAELPLLTQVMREIDKVALLFLSMLYHDVGKGYGKEHSARGAQKVQTAAARWRLSPDDAHEWRTLVQHHLLMSHIAQHRDLAEDSVIADFARTVGTPALLKKLYLLTFADMKAVGPRVWNAWKGKLLDELYLRTLERFETGETVEEGRDARLQRRKAQLRQTLTATAAPEDVAAFLAAMPESYFLSTPEETVPGHLQLLSRFHHKQEDGIGEPYRAALLHFPEREFSELTIATNDRPGLFAIVAGVLMVNGLNIADARITTSRDGIALDVFRLSHMDRIDMVMDADTWTRTYARLGAALRGERTMEDLLRAASPPAYLHKRPARIPTEVTVDNGASPRYTVIDITAPDRMGFLFTVTYALFQLGAVIHLAKITTNVDQVLDVFYVTDNSGAKVADPDGLAHALRNQLVQMNASA